MNRSLEAMAKTICDDIISGGDPWEVYNKILDALRTCTKREASRMARMKGKLKRSEEHMLFLASELAELKNELRAVDPVVLEEAASARRAIKAKWLQDKRSNSQ